MRRILRTGVAALIALGVFCGTATANTRSGNQNPDLVVTASIGPNHLDVGQRSYWTFSVTNTTSHRIRIRVVASITFPSEGGGELIEGTLGPGQSFNEQRAFKAHDGGEYVISVKTRDTNGVSHARASAVA